MAEADMAEIENDDLHVGQPSVFGCPECGGALWEIDQEGLLRFRCRGRTRLHRTEPRGRAALRGGKRVVSGAARLGGASIAVSGAGGTRTWAKLTSLAGFEQQADTAEHNAHILRDFLVNINGSKTDEEIPPAEEVA
jgi:two-component system chemotaxis response regulator CheB